MAEPEIADLALAHRLADEADAITAAAFTTGASIEHRLKSDGTPVSATDQAVEERLLGLIRQHRAEDAVLGEEVGPHGDGHRRWVLDGIDGTTNFVAGRPQWGTLIALVEDGRPILGIHTSPAEGYRTWAGWGAGTWRRALGDPDAQPERLVVAPSPGERRPRVNLELAWRRHPSRPVVDRLLPAVDEVMMTTHPGLMVAAGELDLAVQLAGGPWDFAALMVMVWEAGGRCLDLEAQEVVVPEPPMIHVGGIDPQDVRGLLTL